MSDQTNRLASLLVRIREFLNAYDLSEPQCQNPVTLIREAESEIALLKQQIRTLETRIKELSERNRP